MPDPLFDPEEQKILDNLQPEPDDEYKPADGQADPAAGASTVEASAASPAPAPAEPTPTPAPPAPTPAPPAATPAPTAEPAATPAPTVAPAPADGMVNKGALRAARHEAKSLRKELERKDAELEALKAGKPLPTDDDADMTPEEREELEKDFPAVAKAVNRLEKLEKKVASAAPPPQQEEFIPALYDEAVQSVIDQVPDLVNWQYDATKQDRFARAIEYDNALRADPDWRTKTPAERFEEAARRTKTAFGESAAAPSPSPAPTPAPKNPADVIANAPTQGPEGISDFRGGAPANTHTPNWQGMTDEQIMQSLPVQP